MNTTKLNSAPDNSDGSTKVGLISAVTLIFIIVVALSIVGFVFGKVVPPGMNGVRQINFGPGQGFKKIALKPGYHWRIPFYSEIHLVPRSLQIVNFRREQKDSKLEDADKDFSLVVQTADRASVNIDVSLLVRYLDQPGQIDGAKHNGPAELLSSVGLLQSSWENKVRRSADDALKRALGTLTTQHFYDPEARQKQLEEARSLMNRGSVSAAGSSSQRGLFEDGIEVEAVLLRRYTYREERIENAIFQKNLQDQEARLNFEKKKFSKAAALREEAEAQGDAAIKTELAKGANQVQILHSEGELYEVQKRAEADLLVEKAKAEVNKLKAEALAKSQAGTLFVARELGPLLQSLKGGVVADVDPYDLDRWMKRLGVEHDNRSGVK